MALKKGDFIEIEFTGKVKDGQVFDSNIKEDLKNANLNFEPKPFIFGLGEKMFLEGIENLLVGKEIGEYEIELGPEKAFGERDPKLKRVIPSKVFKENKLNPLPGVTFNFDGRAAKILSVSGGRIVADFNNPLAGKTVVYKIKILRKVDDLKEKAKSLIDFLFKRDLKFEIKPKNSSQVQNFGPTKSKAVPSHDNQNKDFVGDKKIIIIKAEKELFEFVQLFGEKFKSALDLELEVEEVKEDKKESEKENKKSP